MEGESNDNEEMGNNTKNSYRKRNSSKIRREMDKSDKNNRKIIEIEEE